jgi:hypothetical protein
MARYKDHIGKKRPVSVLIGFAIYTFTAPDCSRKAKELGLEGEYLGFRREINQMGSSIEHHVGKEF